MKRLAQILQDIAFFVKSRIAIALLCVISFFEKNADDPYD